MDSNTMYPLTGPAARRGLDEYIYVSGIAERQPLNSAKLWYFKGRYLYDQLKQKVRLATCDNDPRAVIRLEITHDGTHPEHADTLRGGRHAFQESGFKAQQHEIENAFHALALADMESVISAEEEDRLSRIAAATGTHVRDGGLPPPAYAYAPTDYFFSQHSHQAPLAPLAMTNQIQSDQRGRGHGMKKRPGRDAYGHSRDDWD